MNSNIGGFPYILDYLPIYLPYSIVSFLAAIFGFAGNLCVIVAVLINKKLRNNQTCILITNLAISDLVISLFVHPSIVVGVIFGKNFFDQNANMCAFLAAICLISCSTSLFTMGFLAINRYVCIFKIKRYRRHFSIRNTILLCFAAWFLGLIIDLPNFFGIGDHVYDLKVLSCHFDRLKVPYTISFSIFCIILPCVCIGLLYLKIFCYSYRIRMKMKRRKIKSQHYGSTFKAVRIAKSLFASFMLFAACWIPVAIVFVVGRHDQLPIWTHTYANLMAHVNSALNPLLYLIYNPMIKEGLRTMLRKVNSNTNINSQTLLKTTQF